MMTAIVPRLPPAVDGLGDYGLSLAQQFQQTFGWSTHLLVGDPLWSGPREVGGCPVQQVKERSASALLEQLQTSNANLVLLHYVGYGYARRGCPFWLVKGLETWRRSNPQHQLVTMFHEVHCSGEPIWSSAFWTSPLQKQLARRLSCLSDRCLTSRQGYAQMIRQLSGDQHQHIPTLPVFSNVGEPSHLPPLSERSRRVVIFGGSGWRSRVYQTALEHLEQICIQLEISDIVDIGPPLNLPLPAVGKLAIRSLGILPASEISAYLTDAVVGFFNYPIAYLEKSTMFAAYCAHRLLPVGTTWELPAPEGLKPGEHFWLADQGQSIDLPTAQTIADRAYQWYQTHNLSNQTRHFANCLTALSGEG